MYDYAQFECPSLTFDIAANDKFHFWWHTMGFEDCIIQVIPSVPSVTAYVLTVERGNTGEGYVAMSAGYTIAGTGTLMSDRIEIAGSMMRLRVTTDAAATCNGRVIVRLRGGGSNRDRSKEFEYGKHYGWTVN